MASHGFWSLGGDNAGANTGSQSPSTREWLFLSSNQLWRTRRSANSSALSQTSALHLVLQPPRADPNRPAVFTVDTSAFHTFSSFLLHPAGCEILSKGTFCNNSHGASCVSAAVVLKLDLKRVRPHLIYPLSLPARAWCQAAAQKFSGGIGSKLCGMLVHSGGGAGGGGWGALFGRR